MMNEELHNLELEVEREMSRLATHLDAPPGSSVIATVSAAVRHELNEAWLNRQSMPAPDPGTVNRVRSTVSAELAGSAGHRSMRAGTLRPRWGWFTPAHGSLAAAAMVLICFGIIRYAPSPAPSIGVDEVDRLVSAITSRSSNDAIEDAILSLESELEPEENAGPPNDDTLDNLVREIDQIIEDHDPARTNSAIISAQEGVMG